MSGPSVSLPSIEDMFPEHLMRLSPTPRPGRSTKTNASKTTDSNCSFNILRSDPSSSSLQHITSTAKLPSRPSRDTTDKVSNGCLPAFRVHPHPQLSSSLPHPSITSEAYSSQSHPSGLQTLSNITIPSRTDSFPSQYSPEDLSDDGDGEERKHICLLCNKRFNRPSSLKIHMNTHTGATPFRCPFPNCGREFNVNSNMRRHYRNHKNTKPLPPLHPRPHSQSQSQPQPQAPASTLTRSHTSISPSESNFASKFISIANTNTKGDTTLPFQPRLSDANTQTHTPYHAPSPSMSISMSTSRRRSPERDLSDHGILILRPDLPMYPSTSIAASAPGTTSAARAADTSKYSKYGPSLSDPEYEVYSHSDEEDDGGYDSLRDIDDDVDMEDVDRKDYAKRQFYSDSHPHTNRHTQPHPYTGPFDRTRSLHSTDSRIRHQQPHTDERERDSERHRLGNRHRHTPYPQHSQSYSRPHPHSQPSSPYHRSPSPSPSPFPPTSPTSPTSTVSPSILISFDFASKDIDVDRYHYINTHTHSGCTKGYSESDVRSLPLPLPTPLPRRPSLRLSVPGMTSRVGAGLGTGSPTSTITPILTPASSTSASTSTSGVGEAVITPVSMDVGRM